MVTPPDGGKRGSADVGLSAVPRYPGAMDLGQVPPSALAALIEDYLAAGVDAPLDEAPHDRFAEDSVAAAARAPAAEAAPPVAQPAAPGAFLPATPEEAAASARSLARSARSLDELRELMASFEGCALRAGAKSLVFADGNPAARVMLVGEGPGAEEDRSGRPFVGRAGQLLDRMLAAIGLDRSQAYIANVVPWRPPGNRTPTPQELATMKPFIERQIELAAPDILVCLGDCASKTLLGSKDGIMRTRGRWFTYEAGGRPIRALATLHPAFLLRQPLNKRYAWRDLRALRRTLDEVAPEPGRSGDVLSLAGPIYAGPGED